MSELKMIIPENMWIDIAFAPRDGTVIYVKDAEDNVDLAVYDDCGWNAEGGFCTNFTHWAPLSIG